MEGAYGHIPMNTQEDMDYRFPGPELSILWFIAVGFHQCAFLSVEFGVCLKERVGGYGNDSVGNSRICNHENLT